jgi:hypothetical protein
MLKESYYKKKNKEKERNSRSTPAEEPDRIFTLQLMPTPLTIQRQSRRFAFSRRRRGSRPLSSSSQLRCRPEHAEASGVIGPSSVCVSSPPWP